MHPYVYTFIAGRHSRVPSCIVFALFTACRLGCWTAGHLDGSLPKTENVEQTKIERFLRESDVKQKRKTMMND